MPNKSRAGPFIATVVLVAAGCGSAASSTSTGWTFTTYYTAVESLHSGPPVTVVGCRVRNCSHGHNRLGRFPRDFVEAVKAEGTGRITRGTHRGRYLEWSYDVGYWLDTAPLDTDGRPLRPFITAAADPDALPKHTKFRIVNCGKEEEDRSAINSGACRKFRDARWTILDAFTPGLGGRRHIDLYVGEENRRDFVNDSPYSITTIGSAIHRIK